MTSEYLTMFLKFSQENVVEVVLDTFDICMEKKNPRPGAYTW